MSKNCLFESCIIQFKFGELQGALLASFTRKPCSHLRRPLFKESRAYAGTMVKASIIARCVHVCITRQPTPPIFAETLVGLLPVPPGCHTLSVIRAGRNAHDTRPRGDGFFALGGEGRLVAVFASPTVVTVALTVETRAMAAAAVGALLRRDRT